MIIINSNKESLQIVLLCCTSRLFAVCCRLWWFIFGQMFHSYFSSTLLRTLRYSFVKWPPIARSTLYPQCIQVDLRRQDACLDLKRRTNRVNMPNDPNKLQENLLLHFSVLIGTWKNILKVDWIRTTRKGSYNTWKETGFNCMYFSWFQLF